MSKHVERIISDILDPQTLEHRFNLPPERFVYGYAKSQVEIEVFKVAAHGLEVVIVNPSAVLGPVDTNRISGSMVIEPTAVAIEWQHPLIRLPFDSSQLRLSHHYLYCHTSKARRELDLPEPRPFRQATQGTYNWYREQGVI